ncbi:MAG TPA: fumarylacetoacetate hydrolase family protein, partial [Actinomycetota bacterium]|nr:fumarylacetoacetate hydrolase family protein [Actinomycetota bacterium]
MKLVRFRSDPGDTVWGGYMQDGHAVPVLRSDGQGGLALLVDLAMSHISGNRLEPCADPVPLESVRLLAPVPAPPSVRDFYAFEQHVRTARAQRGLDMEPDWYQLPIFYFTNPATIYGPGEEVPHPATDALDYELEAAVVVGRDGSDLSPEQA